MYDLLTKLYYLKVQRNISTFNIRTTDKYVLHVIFFFNDTAPTEIYTLSLHDALPIYVVGVDILCGAQQGRAAQQAPARRAVFPVRRIDARDAQNAGAQPAAPGKAHGTLGVHAALGT